MLPTLRNETPSARPHSFALCDLEAAERRAIAPFEGDGMTAGIQDDDAQWLKVQGFALRKDCVNDSAGLLAGDPVML